jgi:methionine-gamma-lyase
MKKLAKAFWLADATLAIHAGQEKFRLSAPVGTSIARTANFTFASTEEMKRWAEGKSSAYIYTRYGNPTLAVAEAKIAALEGAEAAIVTASGMAAISNALLSVLKSDDEVIATRALYGGSYRMMRDIFPRIGIVVRHVETDLAGIERLVNPRTRALYIETPTNPTLRLVDLRKAIAFAKEWDLHSLIDNTFASPVLQKPIEMGFDLVMHSATKYLAGHSDVIAGAVAGSRGLIDKIRDMIIYLGASHGSGGSVSADSRDENPGIARAAAVRDGFDCRSFLGKASEGGARSLSRIAFASGSQIGQAADEGVWGDDGF